MSTQKSETLSSNKRLKSVYRKRLADIWVVLSNLIARHFVIGKTLFKTLFRALWGKASCKTFQQIQQHNGVSKTLRRFLISKSRIHTCARTCTCGGLVFSDFPKSVLQGFAPPSECGT